MLINSANLLHQIWSTATKQNHQLWSDCDSVVAKRAPPTLNQWEERREKKKFKKSLLWNDQKLTYSKNLSVSDCEPRIVLTCQLLLFPHFSRCAFFTFISVSCSARLSTMHTDTTSRRCTLSRKTRRRLFCLTSTVRITTPSLWTRTAGHRRPWRSRTCDPDHLSLSLNSVCCRGVTYSFCNVANDSRRLAFWFLSSFPLYMLVSLCPPFKWTVVIII